METGNIHLGVTGKRLYSTENGNLIIQAMNGRQIVKLLQLCNSSGTLADDNLTVLNH